MKTIKQFLEDQYVGKKIKVFTSKTSRYKDNYFKECTEINFVKLEDFGNLKFRLDEEKKAEITHLVSGGKVYNGLVVKVDGYDREFVLDYNFDHPIEFVEI